MTTPNAQPQVQGVDYEVSGLGRIVQGDLDTLDNKDYATGKPRLNGDGTEKKPENFFAVAFPKMVPNPQSPGQMMPNPDWARMKAYINKVGKAAWPSFWPGAAVECVNPNFSNKITDGDGYDKQGVHNATKEGFAGCWVMRFSSQFLPKRFYQGRYAPQDQITEPGAIKRGDHVRVIFTSASNTSTQSPGLYVRASSVELCHVGTAIVSANSGGPDAAAGFAGAPAAHYIPDGAQPVVVPTSTAPAAAAFESPPVTTTEPYTGYIPTAPGASAPPPVPVATFPPEGWAVHPQNPAYYYKGTEVLSEADLRARG